MPCRTKKELIQHLKEVHYDERAHLAWFLEVLAEVDEREAYLAEGCGSLYRFCVEKLGLSEHQAYLRMTAARVGRDHPEIFMKIAEGSLTMSSILKLSGALLVTPDPKNLIERAEGLTKREVMELVAEIHPAPDKPAKVEPHPISPGRYHLSVTISGEAEEMIKRARDLGAPRDLAELVETALSDYYQKLVKKKCRTTSARGRKTSTKVKTPVWERSDGQCEHVNEDGVRCTERRYVEFDHFPAVARGGVADSPDKLRLFCWGHNQEAARKLYGDAFMDRKIRERREQLGPGPTEKTDPKPSTNEKRRQRKKE